MNRINHFTSAAQQHGVPDHNFMSDGLFFFSQSFNAAFIRVCQPHPVARKALITSGEYRMDICIFGFSDTGLPRLMIILPLRRVAALKNASSSSGASSGSTQVFFKSFNFAFISFPHRDNAAHFTALRPDHNNKPGIQFSYGDLPYLSIVLPVILAGEVKPCKDFSGSGEIKPALRQGAIPFVLVIFNFHVFIVTTINKKSNIDSLLFAHYTVPAAAKSAAGIRTPVVKLTLNRVSGFFMGEAQSHLFAVSMVGRAGEPQGSPGLSLTGSSNPARLTTLLEIRTSGGELFKLTTEDAIMATTPAQTHPEIPNIYASEADLERFSREIRILLGCASFLACNATQEARLRLVDILVLAERRTQELTELISRAETAAYTRPSRRRDRS